MKLQKSDFLLALCLLSSGAEILGAMPGSLLDWAEKHGPKIVSKLGPDATFEQVRRYADDNNLALPSKLTEEEKGYVLGAIQASIPEEEPAVVVGNTRLSDPQVLRAAREEMEYPDSDEIAAYVRKNHLQIDSFDQLCKAMEASGNAWDDNAIDRKTMTGLQKGNWVRIYKKIFELFDQEHAQRSQQLFKVVEVVQDLAQKEVQRVTEKHRAVKNQLFNVLEVVDMVKPSEQEEKRPIGIANRKNGAAMQQQLDRTLEVVKFVKQKADRKAGSSDKRKRRRDRKGGTTTSGRNSGTTTPAQQQSEAAALAAMENAEQESAAQEQEGQ